MKKRLQQRYSAKYFKECLPDWKRKKDSILVRYIHRPISFFFSSFFCRIGLSANKVSFISLLVGVCAPICFLWNHRVAYIVGAVLVNVWMVLDCADGNIARSVCSEPFGEFIDASSSYTLLNFLFPCMGIAAAHTMGLFGQQIESNWWVFLGAIAGCSDTLGRLLYQKYLNQDLIQSFENKGTIASNRKISRLRTFEDRIDKEIGLNGLFLPFLVIISVIGWFDLFIFFYAVFNFLKLIGTFVVLIKRALIFSI